MKPTIEPNTPRTVRMALPAGLAMLSDLTCKVATIIIEKRCSELSDSSVLQIFEQVYESTK